MRDDNLLAVQARAFVVTMDSKHELEVHLNLASRIKLTGTTSPAHHLTREASRMTAR